VQAQALEDQLHFLRRHLSGLPSRAPAVPV
jgi:hypothetical protein